MSNQIRAIALFAVLLTGCGSHSLSREEATKLIASDPKFKVVRAIHLVSDYSTVTGLLVSSSCPMCEKLESLGYLTTETSGILGLSRKHVLTAKGKSASSGWIQKGGDAELGGTAWEVPVLERKIAGIQGISIDHNRATVVLTWAFQPIGDAGRDLYGANAQTAVSSTAEFGLFDTGWRLTSISDLGQ
jgi:hypothetical protein